MVLTIVGLKFAVVILQCIINVYIEMKDNKEYKDENCCEEQQNSVVEEPQNVATEEAAEQQADELTEEEKLIKENEELKASVEKEKKEYLFLMAEFDNFRKRTMREKSELIKNAAESAFKGLLPVVDDIERAMKASEGVEDPAPIREGMELIYKKLKKYMEQNGVKEMNPDDNEFNSDLHDAITAVPVPDENLKGKIIDTIEKGYTINEKVLRHAKVVVGQ